MIHDEIIERFSGRSIFDWYFEEGRRMRAERPTRGHYRHTTETDLIGKENRRKNNRKKNKLARKARKMQRK